MGVPRVWAGQTTVFSAEAAGNLRPLAAKHVLLGHGSTSITAPLARQPKHKNRRYSRPVRIKGWRSFWFVRAAKDVYEPRDLDETLSEAMRWPGGGDNERDLTDLAPESRLPDLAPSEAVGRWM